MNMTGKWAADAECWLEDIYEYIAADNRRAADPGRYVDDRLSGRELRRDG